MASDRIDNTLITPVMPRSAVMPVRDNAVREGQAEEVQISREARALQALDNGTNEELFVEREQGREVGSYLATQRGSEQEFGSGRIIEGQFQQTALADISGNNNDRNSASALLNSSSPENRSALQAYRDIEEMTASDSGSSVDIRV